MHDSNANLTDEGTDELVSKNGLLKGKGIVRILSVLLLLSILLIGLVLYQYSNRFF